jgi:hypothetical protein
MANFKSSQITKIDSPDYDQLKPNEAHGRLRVAYFDVVTPAGVLINEICELVELPVGARVLGGNIAHGALGASATGSVGYVGQAGRYASAVSMAVAGNYALAGNLTQNYGDELATRVRLNMTFQGANPAAGITIRGHVVYVVD